MRDPNRSASYFFAGVIVVITVAFFATWHWRDLCMNDATSEALRRSAANARYAEVGEELERIAAENAKRNRRERELSVMLRCFRVW